MAGTEKFLLAADIGGTKAHLAIYHLKSAPGQPVAEEILPSGAFSSLEELLLAFLRRGKIKPEQAVLAVAGPIQAGKARITNLAWDISVESLAARLDLKKVSLVNDIVALAASIPLLREEDLITLKEGQPDPNGVIAVIAPGTGLGEAFLLKEKEGWRPLSSEGGHADFAPGNPLEAELYLQLADELGHVSYDRIVSGRGIPRIYRFLDERGKSDKKTLAAPEMGKDPAPAIIAAAMDKSNPCPLAKKTLTIFSRILAAEAGNMALRLLATGGVYLGGGIPPRILPFLKESSFLEAFKGKGRLSHVLEDIPIKVIACPAAALWGAAALGQMMAADGPAR